MKTKINSSKDSISPGNKPAPLVFRRPVSSSPTDIFSKTRKEQFQKAVTEKNPLALPTFEEQGASVQAKLLRLNNNPDYRKLNSRERIGVRARIYNEYVVPSFKVKGLNPPDIKLWLKQTTPERVGYIHPEDYLASPSLKAAQDFGYGILDRANKIAMFGVKLENKALMAQFGIAHFFAEHSPVGSSKLVSNIEANKKAVQKIAQKTTDIAQSSLNYTNFFLDNHPREGFLASAPRWTGEQVAMLPFYEAVSAGMEAAGVKPAAEKIVGNISTKLASSKIGQFVGRRLYSAANFFTSSIITGDSKKEATANAVGAAAVETGLGAIASTPLIKKWAANIIAMGGKPLAEEVANTAIAESTFGRLDHESITNTAFNGRVIETRLPKEKGFRAGYFEHQGERYEYKTPEERFQIYEALEKRLLEHRKSTDPVWHSVMQAEKMSVESIALRNFNKPLAKMSEEEIASVLQRRMELIAEAEYELPAHVGDLNKMDVAEANEKDFAEHPIAGRYSAEMKAEGFPDVDEVVNEEQVRAIEEQTGIKSTKGTVAKIAKVRTKKEKEITSGFASLNADEFTKNRDETIAYFRNPKYERLAADGTRIGRRDKRPWNVRLAAENTAQFIETLKEADGDRINFENPYHRMLYHWSNRDKLPKPVREKLLREMKKQVATGPRPRYNMKSSDFNQEADWALVHLQLLAQSGRLGSEGNIFHSSKFGGPENWTPWQADLQTEVEKQELKTLTALTTRHPEARKALRSATKKLQTMRFEAKSAEEWLLYNEGINKYLKTGIF